jgi:hypothetical protein
VACRAAKTWKQRCEPDAKHDVWSALKGESKHVSPQARAIRTSLLIRRCVGPTKRSGLAWLRERIIDIRNVKLKRAAPLDGEIASRWCWQRVPQCAPTPADGAASRGRVVVIKECLVTHTDSAALNLCRLWSGRVSRCANICGCPICTCAHLQSATTYGGAVVGKSAAPDFDDRVWAHHQRTA